MIGFASAACGTFDPPVVTEGFAVLNGRFLDGMENATNPELTDDEFNAVLIHEFGHYIGLDHSQVSLQEAIEGNPASYDVLATMFPVMLSPSQISLNLDDEVSVSSLYPEASFASDFGTITGSIFLSDGVTPFQGAHVIARAVDDPRMTVVAQVSGAHFFPQRAGGPPDPALRGRFELAGLPPGSYTVEIESIYAGFTGGSSVGPLEIPAPVPGPPEYWNGVDESGTNPPDDPAVSETIVVSAGMSVGAIDLSINQGVPPANDDCSNPVDIDAAPFTDDLDVTGATRGAFDPLQTCSFSAGQNFNSVWYRYTAPADGVLRVETRGSNYDTIVTAATGMCGQLVEAGCDDDSGPQVTSEMNMVAEAGATFLLEVTSWQPGGGLLSLALDFTPAAACPPVQRNDCRTPSDAGRSSIRLRRDEDPASYRLQWKWGPGDTPLAELGDPAIDTGTSYALCIYDAAGILAMTARAPAGKLCGTGAEGCWRARVASVVYKHRELLPDGLGSLKLKSGDGGRAKLSIKGAGAMLDMPLLPLTFPLAVQLLNSDGPCWQANFPIDGVRRNDDVDLQAKGG